MDRAAQHALVVSSDPSLVSEVDSTLGELKKMRWVVHAERDVRRGVEIARDRAPVLICLELTRDLGALKRLAEEMASASPDSVILVACQPEDLRQDESALFLIEVMRSRVSDFIRRPLSVTELEDVVRRHLADPVKRGSAGVRGRIVSFMSNKGGVGKSTLSVSVAASLAKRHPDQVLLVDASLQLGVCASMLDLAPASTIADAAREVDRLDERLLRTLSVQHESGLRVLAAPADAVEATRIDELAISRVLQVARRGFDYVVVDTFPMIDSVAVAILDLSDLLYGVVSSLVPNVLGAARLLQVLERIGLPPARRRVVLNESHPPFQGKLKPTDVAERLGTDIDHVVPFVKKLLVAMNTGDPYALRAPRWSVLRRSIAGIVNEIEALRPIEARAPDLRSRFLVETESDEPQSRSIPDNGASNGNRGFDNGYEHDA